MHPHSSLTLACTPLHLHLRRRWHPMRRRRDLCQLPAVVSRAAAATATISTARDTVHRSACNLGLTGEAHARPPPYPMPDAYLTHTPPLSQLSHPFHTRSLRFPRRFTRLPATRPQRRRPPRAARRPAAARCVLLPCCNLARRTLPGPTSNPSTAAASASDLKGPRAPHSIRAHACRPSRRDKGRCLHAYMCFTRRGKEKNRKRKAEKESANERRKRR